MTSRGITVALGLTGAVALSAPAAFSQDKPIDTVKRSGEWVVNFDEDSCDLIAQFGPPDDLMFLKFTRYSLGEATDLMVAGNRLKDATSRFDVTVDFGLGSQPSKHPVMAVTQSKRPGLIISEVRLDGWEGGGKSDAKAPEITPVQEAAVTRMDLKVNGKKPFRLQFGPLDRAMKIMRQCQADLVQSWGYDPAVIKGVSRGASPASSPGSWVSDDDYPSEALARGHSGLLRFRLDVDASGKVVGCRILDRTDPDDFSKVTCDLLTRRARFKPALDANEKPVRAFYLGSFHWKAG